jgi:hypothetical protein
VAHIKNLSCLLLLNHVAAFVVIFDFGTRDAIVLGAESIVSLQKWVRKLHSVVTVVVRP